jgi:hypothetical protein
MLTYRDGGREMEVEMTDRQDSNFLVALRIRPLNTKETENIEAHPVVTRAVGDSLISFDPPTQAPKGLHVRGSHRHADLRFAFDVVFDHECSQDQVYDRCAKPLIKSVLNGINATVFAYGATGSGAGHARSHVNDSIHAAHRQDAHDGWLPRPRGIDDQSRARRVSAGGRVGQLSHLHHQDELP